MINIAKILKDCPKGMQLYSPICGECKLVGVVNNLIKVEDKDEYIRNFLSDGKQNVNGECLLFPSKDNRDWNTFNKVERSFRPEIGDVVADCCDNVFIYQGKYSEYSDNSNFVVFTTFHNDFFVIEGNDSFQISKAVRYATVSEEELLFDIMDKKGYVYNELNNCISKKEDKRKFKVGDRIIRCNTLYPILTITFVNNMVYTVKSNISNEEHDIGVKIVENNYKIATFSPYDLKPFDKILVKSWGRWGISHFGYFDNGIVYTENEKWYKENVLPYNDETKHLLGTCDDYDGFYKWWE
jgi:hypothetical protein